MSTLIENVEKVKSAHENLKTAIAAKGVAVPENTKLTEMPALVDEIQTGGGGGIQPSDVTWRVHNAFKIGDYEFDKTYPISAENVVNFIDFTCGNDRRPVAMLAESQNTHTKITVNLNDYFI